MNPDSSSPTPSMPAPSTPPVADPTPSAPDSSKLLKIILGAAVITLILAVGILALPTHKKKSPTPPVQSVTEGGKQTESELNNFKQEVTVTITAKGPSPQTLNIPNNSRINWMNKDMVGHKLAITPGTTAPPQFDNNHEIVPNGGYPYVIHQTGTFHYYLVDNPKLGGTVIVK